MVYNISLIILININILHYCILKITKNVLYGKKNQQMGSHQLNTKIIVFFLKCPFMFKNSKQ